MNNFRAIFFKQLTSHIKVPIMIGNAVIFLIIAGLLVLITPSTEEKDCDYCIPAHVCYTCEYEAAQGFQMPDLSGTGLFMSIFVGMALIMGTNALCNEDRSTTNLKFMAMAGMKPLQYILGTFAATFIVFLVLLIPFALLGLTEDMSVLTIFLVSLPAGIVSILFGLVIGLSKFPILALPVGMILGMGPQFAAANELLSNVFSFTHTHQLSLALSDLDADLSRNFMIFAANGVGAIIILILMHRKNKLNV